MEYRYIKHQLEDGVKIIVLNRPEVLNSFNSGMGIELRSELQISSEDENVRAILITAEGRSFCAGQDLNEIYIDGKISNPVNLVQKIYNPIVLLIRTMEKPVVCAVNGTAAGAGANIALCCDIIVASEKATFIQAFTKIGLIPDSGGTFFLPRLVGLQRAAGLIMLNEKLTAEQAYQIGLIYKMIPHHSLNEESLKIAKELASMPTKSLALVKSALNSSFENTLEEQLKLEAELQQRAGETSDYEEGIIAFLEKRNPVFTGN